MVAALLRDVSAKSVARKSRNVGLFLRKRIFISIMATRG